MKKKWYKTNLGVIFLLAVFYPAGLFLMWKHTNWKPKVKWGITAVFVTLFLLGYGIIANAKPDDKTKTVTSETGCIGPDGKRIGLSPKACEEFNNAWRNKQLEVSNSNNTTQPTTVASAKTPTPTKASEKKAEAKKTPEQTFESICNKYGGTNNCSYYKDEVGAWSVTQLIQAKEDFMLFSTSKQISRDFIFAVYATKLPMAHASITITMPGKYYRAGLGADMADTQPDSTWTSNDVGPSIFYDFLKASTNGSAGDELNSTYVETNLD